MYLQYQMSVVFFFLFFELIHLFCLCFRQVRVKIHRAIAQHFKISPEVLYLTHPTFFSRLTNLPPGTEHDEYWHPHVDKVCSSWSNFCILRNCLRKLFLLLLKAFSLPPRQDTYGSFHYTSLLYLSDYGEDFDGGRFVFIDKDNTNTTVEPRKGKFSSLWNSSF